jgi:acetyl esterase/lipase
MPDLLSPLTGKIKTGVCLMLLFLFSFTVKAQQIIELYTDSIPNSKGSEKKETFTGGIYRAVTKPTLEIYLPEKEKVTGTAMVICPGGSYAVLVYQGEGITAAKELAKNGITCFILKYRLPDDSIMQDKSIGPLQDAQQAIKVVRENAAKWGIDKNKIGIMGFSAGGHLA